MKMNKYLSMDSKISLSRTKATDRPQYGKGGEVYQLLYIPRNIPLNDLKTFRSDTQRHIYYVNPTLQELNPYYINYQYSNMDERWRAFGYYTVKIDFTPWLYATGKYSFDYYDTSIEEQNRTNGIDDQSKESYKSMEQRYYEHNIEGMILGHNTFAERFRLGDSLGGNIMYQRTSGLTGYSENMAKEGIWYHNSALGKNTAEQTFTERETRSVFGTLQFAWDEWIALDLTARNDWSSTLPKNNCSYFYPSANLSWVFSDMMRRYDMGLPSWITFGKLRLSAAQDWSAHRWDHFYKDRSAEYKTLVNTFYYVDRKAYKNAFYMTRIFYAFLASTMTDTYGEMPFGVYVQGKAAPEKCPYNTQEEVYDMVFRMLTEAADSIQPGQCSFKFADREDKCYNDRLNIYNGTQENPFAGSNKKAQLEQIITQKWLAVFPNGNEGWAEFRRTDYPRLNNHLSNKDPNIANGKFIKRVGYSTDEYAYNIENVPEGVNQSTRVWWDVQDTNNENGERNTPNNFR